MNNSYIAFGSLEADMVDTTVLRQKQQELLKIIEAVSKVANSGEWKQLRELVFDKQVERLEKELKSASLQNELNSPEIYRLQGKITWAKRYSDFYKLTETYKTELKQITLKLETNENATI